MKIWGLLLILSVPFQSHAFDTYTLTHRMNVDSQDFEVLPEVLSHPGSSDIEGFLSEWKKSRPSYFTNYVSAYRSRSLQQADRLHPRIIMFNDNADLVMSFNGHPQYRGYNEVEMMHFNRAKSAFEFYELAFTNGKGKISAPNQQKCLECHQSSARDGVDPRPNWEPYSVWLGFFGSLDDRTDLFKTSFTRDKQYRAETDSVLLSDFDNEYKWYEDFKTKVIPTTARYSLLGEVVNDLYQDEATLNGDFTNRVAVLNFRRVARLMKEQKAVYEKVKWTVYSYAVCTQTLFVGPGVADFLKKASPYKELTHLDPPVYVKLPCMGQGYMKDLCDPNYEPPVDPYYLPGFTNTDLINLMFEPFGVRTEDWSMDFKTGGRFAFEERFGVTNDPRPPIQMAIQEIFGEDPDFKNVDCDTVKARSLENFGTLEKAQAIYNELQSQLPAPKLEKPLINRCISCHVGSDRDKNGPPSIPFNEPAALKIALQKGGYKRGTLLQEIMFRTGPEAGQDEQMPPKGIPTLKAREELLNYLKSL